jgi:hypothetical protein
VGSRVCQTPAFNTQLSNNPDRQSLTPWSGELHILEWAVVAFLLFRYWPLAEPEPAVAITPPVRLESAIQSSVSRGIMKLAGEPGDRWPGHRKMTGREESPDTVVVGSQEPVTK